MSEFGCRKGTLASAAGAVLAVLGVALSACGTPTQASSVSGSPLNAPTTTASPTTQAVAPTTSAVSPGPDYGPVKKTSVLDITTDSGYQAAVTVRWHQEKLLTPGDLLSSCTALTTPGEFDANTVLEGVVAEVTTDFKTTKGFEWPSNLSLEFSYNDGRMSTIAGRAYTCYSDEDTSSPASLDEFTLDPNGHGAVTIMWFRAEQKTPSNPTGKIDDDAPDLYQIQEAGAVLYTCSGQNVQQGCSASYGR